MLQLGVMKNGQLLISPAIHDIDIERLIRTHGMFYQGPFIDKHKREILSGVLEIL